MSDPTGEDTASQSERTSVESDGHGEQSRAAHVIADDMATYLEDHPGACAEGNVHGWRWIRYVNSEWRAVKYGGEHRRSQYVHGEVLDRDDVVAWLKTKPVTIIPIGDAQYGVTETTTVWADAAEQHAFTDTQRCFYCGTSSIDADLVQLETVENGQCLLCGDCEATWDAAGELIYPSENDEAVPTDTGDDSVDGGETRTQSVYTIDGRK